MIRLLEIPPYAQVTDLEISLVGSSFVLFTEDQAREVSEKIKSVVSKFLVVSETCQQELREAKQLHFRAVQSHLVRMRDRQGYLSLGFGSMKRWLEAEFEEDVTKYQRWIVNADWHMEIYGQYQVPRRMNHRGLDKLEDVLAVAEYTTRQMTYLPRSEWKDVWEIAKQIARMKVYKGKAAEFCGGKVTALIAMDAAHLWKKRGEIVEPCIVVYEEDRSTYPTAMREHLEACLDTDYVPYLEYIINRTKIRIDILVNPD
jgi:hypothetical protein